MVEFDKLPLVIKGESKEVRYAGKGKVWIRYLPTIYSFTHNRCGIVEGSDQLRLQATERFLGILNMAGIKHAYHFIKDGLVYADFLMPHRSEFTKYGITPFVPEDIPYEPRRAPPIEVIVKQFHMGTSKHRYVGMHRSEIRNTSVYAGKRVENEGSYPEPIVRFDWRNPLKNKDARVADEILPEDLANLFIDVKKAKALARKTLAVLQEFLNTKDVVICDLCLFIDEEGECLYGEISQDCGRYRHYELGSLDKDVWRTGGSGDDVLKKWKILVDLMETKDTRLPTPIIEGNLSFVVASSNSGKISEIQSIMTPLGCEVRTKMPSTPVEETGHSFEENARIKARAYAEEGVLTISEDSGICVAALNERPGIHSARYSGAIGNRSSIDFQNNVKLLEDMRNIEEPNRAAKFVVALCVTGPGGIVLFESTGTTYGQVAKDMRGQNGFGYDPVFIPNRSGGYTYAEMDDCRKNLRSHRKTVLQNMQLWLSGSLRFRDSVRVVVDGNDGTGKTTLVSGLRSFGYNVSDRGLPTKATDVLSVGPAPGEFYIILDSEETKCQERLLKTGKSLTEKYHNLDDLRHYRKQFERVAILFNASVINVDKMNTEEVLGSALRVLMTQHQEHSS